MIVHPTIVAKKQEWVLKFHALEIIAIDISRSCFGLELIKDFCAGMHCSWCQHRRSFPSYPCNQLGIPIPNFCITSRPVDQRPEFDCMFKHPWSLKTCERVRPFRATSTIISRNRCDNGKAEFPACRHVALSFDTLTQNNIFSFDHRPISQHLRRRREFIFRIA
jgi:hypothetical protein